MRLRKKLMVAGQEYGLVNDNVALYYNRPGRAVFQVRATDEQAEALTGMVQFALGWAHSDGMTLFFTGDIERAVRVDGQQRRLFCREISSRLDSNIPLAIRHATLKDVLGAYAAATGLEFILPDKPYASVKAPAFYGHGSGFHGLACAGDIFGIADYHWQAQGDGKIFVGSWADSRWPYRPGTISEEFFTAAGSAARKIAAIPTMRPGAVLNGQRVRMVRFSGHNMTVGFEDV